MSKTNIGKRFFKLINNEIIFGDCEVVKNNNGDGEILVKNPYTVKDSNLAPLMYIEVGEYCQAVQIHPMNILYSFPLSEFPNLEKTYIEKTTGLVTESKPSIIV